MTEHSQSETGTQSCRDDLRFGPCLQKLILVQGAHIESIRGQFHELFICSVRLDLCWAAISFLLNWAAVDLRFAEHELQATPLRSPADLRRIEGDFSTVMCSAPIYDCESTLPRRTPSQNNQNAAIAVTVAMFARSSAVRSGISFDMVESRLFCAGGTLGQVCD